MPTQDGPVHIRRNIESNGDPYLQHLKPEEIAVCRVCRSVYHAGRWELEGRNGRLKKTEHVVDTLCPACRKTKDHVPGGILTMSGGFLKSHRSEIAHLLDHENKRAMEINPLERIMEMEELDGSLIVLTTNEKLAQRLGRAVHKAYSGDIEYKWSEDTKLARVNWRRENSSQT